jgi:hypothetical protein
MGDDRSSGSNAGVVILIALLVPAVLCCGGAAFLGLGVFTFRAAEMRPVPMNVQLAPQMPEEALELQPLPDVPVEPDQHLPAEADPSFKDLLPSEPSAGESKE